jgi:hypothetical protein
MSSLSLLHPGVVHETSTGLFLLSLLFLLCNNARVCDLFLKYAATVSVRISLYLLKKQSLLLYGRTTNYRNSKHSTEQLCLVAQVGDAIQRKLMQTTVPNIRVTTSTITVLCLDERLRTRCYSHYHNHQRYSRPKFINQHRHSLD